MLYLLTVISSEYSLSLSNFDQEGSTFADQNQCITLKDNAYFIIDVVKVLH